MKVNKGIGVAGWWLIGLICGAMGGLIIGIMIGIIIAGTRLIFG